MTRCLVLLQPRTNLRFKYSDNQEVFSKLAAQASVLQNRFDFINTLINNNYGVFTSIEKDILDGKSMDEILPPL